MNTALPSWFKQHLPEDIALSRMRLLSEFSINTVCKQARCPNQGSCLKNSRLTFMILGNICTRNCRFCGVEKSDGRPLGLDLEEPFRIAEVVKKLGLRYVVITSVTRDDLQDRGAEVFAKTVNLIHALNKDIKIEVLIPDFSGNTASLKAVIDSQPTVLGHNIETVKRLHSQLKSLQASFQVSLDLLRKIKELNPGLTTKSSLILGMGETEAEVIGTMQDLKYVHCDILTFGQYLAPSIDHYPVQEFVSIEQFRKYREIGMDLGFKAVLSAPLVRSSYQAEEVYNEVALS